jgi:DNA topoisomerase-3
MERGELTRDAFMRDIALMTQIIVKRAKEFNSDTIPGDYATLKAPCPNCGKVVKENYRRFACSACEFSISKTPAGRTFELAEVEDLLINKETPLMVGFRSKRGFPFAAILRIVEDAELPARFKMEFDFGQSDDDEEAPDFSALTPIGKCIKCAGKVYDNGVSYVCENSVGLAKNCDFRSGKVILQQEISVEQMTKLLTTGRTDLLTSFKSARTGRMFKAFLVNNKGKTAFEFEAKAAKAPAKGAKAKVDDDGVVLDAAPLKTTARKTTTKTAAVKKPAVKKVAAKTAAKPVAASAVKKAVAKKPAVKKAATVKKVD